MTNEILIFASAFFAGLVNSIAGGGTFLTFPVLIFSGVPAIVANATSAVALWPGTVTATISYRKHLISEPFVKKIIFVVIAGSILGSFLLLFTPEQNLKAAIPYLLLFASFVFTFGKKIVDKIKKNNAATSDLPNNRMNLKRYAYIFAASVYGGYFGAGMGILILALFELLSFGDIYKMSALKTLVASTVNGVAVVIFIFAGIVDYKIAGIMVFAAIMGGFLGANYVQKTSAKTVRTVIMVIAWSITAMAFYKF
jgi:uncharacterized membrane protein YfcA